MNRRVMLGGMICSGAATLPFGMAWPASDPDSAAPANLARNERATKDFFPYMQQHGIDAAFDRYIALNFISHSQGMPGGRKGFYDFMRAMSRLPPWRGTGPKGSILVAERDLVAELVISPFASDVVSGACTIWRFNKAGQMKERWGFWQPWREPFAPKGYVPNEDLLYKEPAGPRGNEARYAALALSFFSALRLSRDLPAHVRRYVGPSFRQHDVGMMSGRDGYIASLALARSHGATWDIKHTIAERDTVVLVTLDSEPLPEVVMLDPQGDKSVPTKGPVIPPPDDEPGTIRAMGAMGDAGRGQGPLLGSPEQEMPGSAAIVTLRFDADGKIVEHWRLRQPFSSFWAYSGRWNARSVF